MDALINVPDGLIPVDLVQVVQRRRLGIHLVVAVQSARGVVRSAGVVTGKGQIRRARAEVVRESQPGPVIVAPVDRQERAIAARGEWVPYVTQVPSAGRGTGNGTETEIEICR